MATELTPTTGGRTTRWAFGLVIGGGLLAAAGWLATSLGNGEAAGPPAPTGSERPAQPVRAFTVERGPIRAWVFAQGTARSVRREYLTFERNGRVTYLKPGTSGRDLRPGDPVSKGEVLARLDSRQLQSEIDSATAVLEEAKAQAQAAEADAQQAGTQLGLAQAKLRRDARLLQSNASAQEDYEESEANLKNARAAKNAAEFKIKATEAGVAAARAKLRQAEVVLDETELVSPIDGVIAYLNIEEGFYFTQTMVRTTSESEALQSIPMVIIDTSTFEVTVDIPAYEAGRVEVGQTALFVPGGTSATAPFHGGGSEWPIRGEVFSVNPAVNPGGRSVRVDIRTTAGADQLRDGMYVACWIRTQEKADAITAPFDAFLFEENRPYAFVVSGDGRTVERRDVVFGIQGLDRREITSGVEAGERLVTDGRYRLVDGAPVRVVEDAGEVAK